ncbi:PIN domain-containing protein [Candidatus Woesearchaeota archaeon]|nr:PIN domain-containing protein [Candidatus Woesearchaeota archaeon]
MTKTILDASGWIEYLRGGFLADKVEKVLDEEECYTSLVTLAEITSKVKRKGYDPHVAFRVITTHSNILPLTLEDAFQLGILHAEERMKKPSFGFGDATLLAMARKIGGKILTKDAHFKDKKEAIMLNKDIPSVFN